jgi:hypothetical protein
MDWTDRFFHYMAKTWENIESEQSRAEGSGEEELLSHNESGEEDELGREAQLGGPQLPVDQQSGSSSRAGNIYTRSLAAYAARERAKWNQMAVRAHAAFSAIRLKHGIEQ